MTPIFCAITHDKNGQLLNTNADTIAAEISIAMANQYNISLIYTFEMNGVLRSIEDKNSVIENIDSRKYETLKLEGIITDGMLPKMENCFNALEKGVEKVVIGNPSVIRDKNQSFTTLIL